MNTTRPPLDIVALMKQHGTWITATLRTEETPWAFAEKPAWINSSILQDSLMPDVRKLIASPDFISQTLSNPGLAQQKKQFQIAQQQPGIEGMAQVMKPHVLIAGNPHHGLTHGRKQLILGQRDDVIAGQAEEELARRAPEHQDVGRVGHGDRRHARHRREQRSRRDTVAA